MEYQLHKSDLQNDALEETLHALSDCYNQLHLPLYVVGASARDIANRLLDIPNTARRTLDLDVAVALQNWAEYEQLTQILLQNNFIKAPEKQRFYYIGSGVNKFEVDIVPFGSIAEQEQVAWPPEGSPVMSVKCFDDVMRHADKVDIDGEYAFYIASLSGQFIIKLDTWQDRHLTTRKDAVDMIFILQNVYVAYALSRQVLPTEITIDTEQFDVIIAGAEWIASDLRNILSEEHRKYYAQTLLSEIAKEEDSDLLNDMLDVSDSSKYNVIHRALTRIAEILQS